ncbi:radiation-inducible immediate-early gene IEX-1 isoform X3 [Haemorhous mexicanus]|uniref:radiation-inducible immediate-early gene IEX-1 isoform X3 n=1 Tax=Haemorhous mexicanus TaxID=30427 RepID=UPI0028BE44CE|nr:radiation-inducible immediate-early gene IEX-1 isoform X3 [Haemorhous mexicanus]
MENPKSPMENPKSPMENSPVENSESPLENPEFPYGKPQIPYRNSPIENPKCLRRKARIRAQVRRPLPSEEPSAAKRLLLLLLAVVGTQIYNAPGDVSDVTSGGTRPPPIPEGPQIPAGSANGTTAVAPTGGSCPSWSVSPPWSPPLSPLLSPPGGARTR